MVGIAAFDVYVPRHRLGSETSGWSSTLERWVSNCDEDSVTIEVAAFGVMGNDWGFVHFPESFRASHACYQEAGIASPSRELDMAMAQDTVTITAPIIYEDLWFSPRSRGSEDVEAGAFTLEGGLPVNTDGGLKWFGHPVRAGDIRMIYEVYNMLKGKAAWS